MKRAYDRLIAIGKAKGHYKNSIFERQKIEAPTTLKFYKGRLADVQNNLIRYRPMKLNYIQVKRVSRLRMFEDELKRRIAECRV